MDKKQIKIVKWALALLPFIGGIVSRAHGGGFREWGEKYLNKTAKNIIWSCFFVFGIYFTAVITDQSDLVTYILSAITFAGCMLKSTGHGQYFLSRQLKAITPERFDFVIRPFFGKDWRTTFARGHKFSKRQKKEYYDSVYDDLYKRNLAGMALVGFLAVSGAVVAFSYINLLSGLIIAVGGCMKALAYATGEMWLHDNQESGIAEFNHSTEVGEGLTGVFAYGALAVAMLVAI